MRKEGTRTPKESTEKAAGTLLACGNRRCMEGKCYRYNVTSVDGNEGNATTPGFEIQACVWWVACVSPTPSPRWNITYVPEYTKHFESDTVFYGGI